MSAAAVGHNNVFYQPQQDDVVIGIVEKRMNDDWLVDIGFSHFALLPSLSFDGATKKNAPKFQKGECVAAYVEEVPAAGEIVLSCISRTKNDSLGRITGGTLVRARPKDLLLIQQYQFLEEVAKKSAITQCFGKNGRLYIDLKNAVTTILVSNAIIQALSAEDPIQEFQNLLSQIDFPSV